MRSEVERLKISTAIERSDGSGQVVAVAARTGCTHFVFPRGNVLQPFNPENS